MFDDQRLHHSVRSFYSNMSIILSMSFSRSSTALVPSGLSGTADCLVDFPPLEPLNPLKRVERVAVVDASADDDEACDEIDEFDPNEPVSGPPAGVADDDEEEEAFVVEWCLNKPGFEPRLFEEVEGGLADLGPRSVGRGVTEPEDDVVGSTAPPVSIRSPPPPAEESPQRDDCFGGIDGTSLSLVVGGRGFLESPGSTPMTSARDRGGGPCGRTRSFDLASNRDGGNVSFSTTAPLPLVVVVVVSPLGVRCRTLEDQVGVVGVRT